MVYPATVWELPLAGPQRPESPTQPISPFLSVQFLFLVLRYCDESRFSSNTSCVCLGGAGPPTAASLRLPPTPTSSVVWALSCRSKQKRGCLVPLSASPAFCTVGSLWVGENLPAQPGCYFSALPSTWS